MRKSISIVTLIIICAFLTSCSKDDSDNTSVIGTWHLTTWTIQVPIDLNIDMISSSNLLDEALCDNKETLKFDSNGTVSSNMTYNPQVTISLREGTTDNFVFNVVCDTEGMVGTSGVYSQNNDSVTLFNTNAVINGNQLTLVYEDAIDIYTEDLTEVIGTKDLTLVYTRK